MNPGTHFLKDALIHFRKTKNLAERAMAQIPDEHFFAVPDDESNSVAVIVKHLAGNLRSRWTDFLTTDGEKPDRHRDSEFIIDQQDTRTSLMQRWETGWQLLFDAIAQFRENDLSRTVHIRGEPLSVLEAINRQLVHHAYHVGQVVFLARHYTGKKWQSLTIPRGKSKEFEVLRRKP